MQTKANSNAVTSKRLTGNLMANSSNISNNTQSASTNGELNVVSSASLVTAKAQQQTKSTADTITQQQLPTSSTASTHVITVVTPTSSSQPHGKLRLVSLSAREFSGPMNIQTNIQTNQKNPFHSRTAGRSTSWPKQQWPIHSFSSIRSS